MSPTEFAALAETWIGVPYHHQGRSRLGVDCAGLPEALLREAGALPAGYSAPRNYGRHPAAEMERVFERWCTRIQKAQNGCLVQIKWPMQNLPSHVGILVGDDIIHAYKKGGGVVRQTYRGAWVHQTVAFWLAPGVTP